MIAPVKASFIKGAIYLSYTSLSDFLKCPRAYYLKNVYRDPKTTFKLQVTSPYLTLGGTIHDVIKWFLEQSVKPDSTEVKAKFRDLWQKYRLKRGGFTSLEEEATFGKRGLKMLDNFLANYQILGQPVKLLDFPKYPLLADVILIGNFDFVGEKKDGSLQIVDFKTGSHDEDSALQLHMYAILAEGNYQKSVTSASFWYLDRQSTPQEVVLDPLEDRVTWLKDKAKEIKQAIEKNEWVCRGGEQLCRDCRDYTALINGQGEFMFSDQRYKKEIFYLKK